MPLSLSLPPDPSLFSKTIPRILSWKMFYCLHCRKKEKKHRQIGKFAFNLSSDSCYNVQFIDVFDLFLVITVSGWCLPSQTLNHTLLVKAKAMCCILQGTVYCSMVSYGPLGVWDQLFHRIILPAGYPWDPGHFSFPKENIHSRHALTHTQWCSFVISDVIIDVILVHIA